MEWNRPNRTDKQLILIASIIGNMFTKEQIPMDKFELKYEFKTKQDRLDEETLKQKAEQSKAIWGAMGGTTVRRISRKQAIEEGRIEA